GLPGHERPAIGGHDAAAGRRGARPPPPEARELQVELRVASHPELLDRAPLQRVEGGPRVVEATEDGKRQRQDRVVYADALRPVGGLEIQGDTAIALAPERP